MPWLPAPPGTAAKGVARAICRMYEQGKVVVVDLRRTKLCSADFGTGGVNGLARMLRAKEFGPYRENRPFPFTNIVVIQGR